MKPFDYLELLQQASSSELGLKVHVYAEIDGWSARRVRRRLYQARDQARRRGDRSFDHLSVCLRFLRCPPAFPKWEVWIIRRDRLLDTGPREDEFDVETSPLAKVELPRKILARGPNRPRSRSVPKVGRPKTAAILESWRLARSSLSAYVRRPD